MRTPSAYVAAMLLTAAAAFGQDLEPRAYSPSPVGTTFIVVGATRSSGGVFSDASTPITDVDATVGILGLSAGHTFGLAGKQVLLLGILPVTWGEASGAVGEGRRFASRRGLADPRIRLSTILIGSPAMTPAAFARAQRRTILGVSLTMVPPIGQYDPAKLVNLGSNRWTFKPEMGVSHPRGRWTFDAYAGVSVFTTNDTYYPGASSRDQAPIVSAQGHVSYTFGRRAWIAVDATWYTGGRTSIDGVDRADLQRNTRLGVTYSHPLGARQSVKVAYSTGATTRVGADFRTITAAWQLVVF